MIKIKPFPIYDELAKKANPNNKLDKRYSATINRFSPDHRELFFALIYHYYVINNDNNREIEHSKYEIPYSGKTGIKGKGVGFDVNAIPPTLQSILVGYIDSITV